MLWNNFQSTKNHKPPLRQMVCLQMLDRIVAIRSQYAVDLAYCRSFPAAEQEIERLKAYAGGLSEKQRRDIDGQRALIADFRAGNGPQRCHIIAPIKFSCGRTQLRPQARIGRNAQCQWGSGLKFKKRHAE